jgi:hypothetical protein
MGWSRPLIDAINSIVESSALGSSGRTMWYSTRHSSTADAAAAAELGKAPARAASKKGRSAREKRKSGRRDAPRRASSRPWRPAWILQSRAC